MRISNWKRWLLAGVLGAWLAPGTSSASLILGNVADAELKGTGSITNGGADTLRVGSTANNSDGQRNAVFVFDLSSLGTNTVTSASLNIFLKEIKGTLTGINADLYGLGFSTGSSPTLPSGTLNFSQSSSGSGTLLQDNFITTSTSQNSFVVKSGSDLVSYLNSRPDASQVWAYFRVSQDANAQSSSQRYYSLVSGNPSSNKPFLELESTPRLSPVPEPSTLSVAVLGLGGLGLFAASRRRRHS